MNSKLNFIFILCHFTFVLYSQVTITELSKIEERVVLKPTPYDSLTVWKYQNSIHDYKQYLGHNLYWSPKSTPTINESGPLDYKERNILSIKPNLIPVNQTKNKLGYYYFTNNSYEFGEYDSIITYVYKPYHYNSFSYDAYSDSYISPDYDSITNKYYRFIDLIYGNKLNQVWDKILNNLNSYENNNIIFSDRKAFIDFQKPEKIFVIVDLEGGDSLYIKENIIFDEFILVPHFVKQQQLCKNKNFIYDDEKTNWGDYKNQILKEFDIRYIVKYDDGFGNEDTKEKEVFVNPGSKWFCTDVTLLKPTYKLHYILENNKKEQIALKSIDGFIEEKAYIERESKKKIELQKLKEQQEIENLKSESIVKKAIENRKNEYVNLYGQINGELIAQGKVKIKMTKEMCKHAWGKPLWSDKITTEHGVTEIWYYGFGYSLYFEDGILKVINE